MKNKRILVTGGAGFIGSNLVDRLIEKGNKVVVIDNLSSGKKENLNPKAKFYKIDICSSKIEEIFKKEKPEIVFHLAAKINLRKSIDDPISDAKANILGSLNIFENCKKNNVKKIVFASTGGAIYGEDGPFPSSENFIEKPLSPYGIAKLSAEKYLYYYEKVFKIPSVSLRFSNVYGQRQNAKGEAGVIAIFSNSMILKKQPLIFGNGKQTRDFIHVDDIVSALVAFSKKNVSGVFNVGSQKETSVNEIFRKIKNLTEFKKGPKYVLQKEGEQKRSCLDISKAKKEIGFGISFDLDKGLEKTVLWFKNNI
ncbi:MAG: NAD-dependent epimerase/dehydratase family protein [Candidatus Pacebacteria bacterium]|nr:NAD-dependent epimerase/dehydratase family protein [Candidatus Paceibacterota bacterium]MDD5446089.1 NAD-dependent epimerase/dehydratase family protein [Candidatus Paceibacterota bacterium]